MIEFALSDYPPHDQDCFRKCAALSVRIRQLAQSHPLLFFALATGCGPEEGRKEAVRRAEQGRPLRDVCAALDFAYSLRRVPPSALAAQLVPVPMSERGGQILANRVSRIIDPVEKQYAVMAAFYGTRVAGEAFGLWLSAQRQSSDLPVRNLNWIRPLALYAWFTSVEGRQPREAVPRRWSPCMSWGSAIDAARLWVDYLKFQIHFEQAPIADTWAQGGQAGGYDFVPLDTYPALMEEVRDMGNCLYSYADHLARHDCRLFGVRRRGAKAGTIEIRPESDGKLRIVQFRGPGNATMGLEAWHAAQAWIERQPPADPSLCYADCDLTSILKRDHGFAALLERYERDRELPKGFWKRPPRMNRLMMELTMIEHPRRRGPRRRVFEIPRRAA